MEADGADLIDIGGESTRPGADPVSADEELARVLPVLDGARGAASSVPISIDTYKADVARAALAAGAVIVNDVSGLRHDPALARVVAETGAALVLMHTRGRSKTMYAEADYGDVVGGGDRRAARERRPRAGRRRAARARRSSTRASGLPNGRRTVMVCWPGCRSSRRRSTVRCSSGRRASRSCARRSATGRRRERDWGTAAAVTAAVLAGAHIVRVHAVAEMAQVVRVAEEITTGTADG